MSDLKNKSILYFIIFDLVFADKRLHDSNFSAFINHLNITEIEFMELENVWPYKTFKSFLLLRQLYYEILCLISCAVIFLIMGKKHTYITNKRYFALLRSVGRNLKLPLTQLSDILNQLVLIGKLCSFCAFMHLYYYHEPINCEKL